MTDGFYTRRSLNVEIYAARTATLPVVEGDFEFYLGLARQAPGPTLELGCGTGRLVIPLAREAISITGLDMSESMLDVAEDALSHEPEDVQARATFVEGNMTNFNMDEQFGLVFIAFRSFMMLDSAEKQRACLECVHRHLLPGGTLAIDIFDPQLERMTPGAGDDEWRSLSEMLHPETWNVVKIEVSDRQNDPVSQVFEETWRFTELGEEGVVRQEEEVLRMRWTYRNEMRYLLELCGFEVVAEYSDYKKSPPAYGKEQVWVARRR